MIDDAGDERTVRDPAFRDSHTLLGGDAWLRTGTFRAWRVSETLVLRTLEGQAVAQPGDWVVEGSRGERWPVTDEQFRRTYTQRRPGRLIWPRARPGQAASGRPVSSSVFRSLRIQAQPPLITG